VAGMGTDAILHTANGGTTWTAETTFPPSIEPVNAVGCAPSPVPRPTSVRLWPTLPTAAWSFALADP
jgi:hypothetical protein